MIKYWPQIAISAFSLLLLILVFVRNVLAVDVSLNGWEWLLGANILCLATCIAISILRPEDKTWRYAALFNAWPFILVLIAGLFRFGA